MKNDSVVEPAAAAMSETVLSLFHASSSLMAAGDRLVAQLGLTSSRWQVLGTIVAAARPQPVAWLARDMGANRQNVQRVVNDLMREGFVTTAKNPHHLRASLVVLTAKGQEAFDQAMELRGPWMSRLTSGISVDDILAMQRVLDALRVRLDSEINGHVA
ncbi:MarR family winged helix-turn-helix transcriptional regulator [Acidovorax sp. LjRoot194]|uniref:MarR family winged helix-turn-helix transcriptional regulator n=1 Tax=Acidovorax sp. LjRoot194 TaxID=3342280 RepID=UPI003ED16F39